MIDLTINDKIIYQKLLIIASEYSHNWILDKISKSKNDKLSVID